MLTKNKIPRFMLAFSAILVFSLAITACSAQQPPAETQEDASVQTAEVLATFTALPEQPTAAPVETEELVQEPVDEPTVQASGEEEGYPAPGYQFPTPTTAGGAYPVPEQGEAPPVKTSLEATDPATVVLASGKPQLVEFFAFW